MTDAMLEAVWLSALLCAVVFGVLVLCLLGGWWEGRGQ